LSDQYPWSEAFQKKLLAILVRRPDSSPEIFEPRFFSNPILVDLARLAKETYDTPETKHVELSRSAFMTVVRNYLGKNRKGVWPGYRSIIKKIFRDKMKDFAVVHREATNFARDAKFRDTLVTAEKDINSGNYERVLRRFADLKDFGHGEKDIGVTFWEGVRSKSRWTVDRSELTKTWYFPRLDKSMGGGVGGGEMVIVLGGGKVGKSTLLGRVGAGALWQAKNVAIASGELSAVKYRRRIDSMITGIPYADLRKLRRKGKKWGKSVKRLELMRRMIKGNLYIKQFPSGKATLGDVERWMDNVEEKTGNKIDILILDALYLFNPNQRFEERRLNIGQAAIELRGIAIERDIPVWTAAQPNRAGLDKPILGPADFAEDISQFWTLDFLIAICQSQNERITDEDRERGVRETARLALVAARDVGRGAIINVELDRPVFGIKEKGIWVPPPPKEKEDKNGKYGKKLL
jgi:hypothetical protein